MIVYPDSRGPDTRTCSSSRIACNEPPVTGNQKVQEAQRLPARRYRPAQAIFALIGHMSALWVCRPEVAVHQSRVEAEVLQPGLQGGHVIAVHRGAELMRQRPRTQSVGRFRSAR